jgi:DNA-binding CsgD family transcriptional regulator/tetratricopeptide (TPR) repeat protein
VAFEAQMLYGVNVFARAKGIPDLAISRGELAYERSRELGDRSLEFLSAGGTALALLDVGDVDGAMRWLDRAAATALESPTPLRARRLETWRGLAHASAGDAERMLHHLGRAVDLAAEGGQAAARCEALAQLALASARLGAERGDDELLDRAEQAARSVKDLVPDLPGHPPWDAQADAALARVSMARGRVEEAAGHARSALTAIESARQDDLHLEVLAPMATALSAANDPRWEQVRDFVRLFLGMIARRTLDEAVRVRWFGSPTVRELVEVTGMQESVVVDGGDGAEARLDDRDADLLRLLMQGRTNAEIGGELGLDENAVARRLGELFARTGTSSRAEATAFAFRERVV